ncbi:hypothetical protein ZWY2020_039046, partial [Hordeum vulgare]
IVATLHSSINCSTVICSPIGSLENIFPPPQASVSARSHVEILPGTLPDETLEGFFIIIIGTTPSRPVTVDTATRIVNFHPSRGAPHVLSRSITLWPDILFWPCRDQIITNLRSAVTLPENSFTSPSLLLDQEGRDHRVAWGPPNHVELNQKEETVVAPQGNGGWMRWWAGWDAATRRGKAFGDRLWAWNPIYAVELVCMLIGQCASLFCSYSVATSGRSWKLNYFLQFVENQGINLVGGTSKESERNFK